MRTGSRLGDLFLNRSKKMPNKTPSKKTRSIKWVALRTGIGYQCIKFPRNVIVPLNRAFREKSNFEADYDVKDGANTQHFTVKLNFDKDNPLGHVLKMWYTKNRHNQKTGKLADKTTSIIGVHDC